MKKLVMAMAKEYFNLNVDIKVKIKSGMGCYALFKGGLTSPSYPLPKTYKIDLSLDHMVLEDSIRETILHELIHAKQWEQGLPVDHGKFFMKEAKRVGIKGA